jgi:hypothetical protein
MSNANATIIAESPGGLVEVDNSDNLKLCKKSFLRICVVLPLEDSLPTGFILYHLSKPSATISYQFECLSEFCYACGRLGHLSYQCPIVPRPPENRRFGPKLKASSPFTNRVELLLPPKRTAKFNGRCWF